MNPITILNATLGVTISIDRPQFAITLHPEIVPENNSHEHVTNQFQLEMIAIILASQTTKKISISIAK